MIMRKELENIFASDPAKWGIKLSLLTKAYPDCVEKHRYRIHYGMLGSGNPGREEKVEDVIFREEQRHERECS